MDHPVYMYLHSTCYRLRGGGGDHRPRVRNETVLVENRSFPEDNRDSGLHHDYPDRHIPQQCSLLYNISLLCIIRLFNYVGMMYIPLYLGILTIVVFAGFNSQTIKSRHNRCTNYNNIMPSVGTYLIIYE